MSKRDTARDEVEKITKIFGRTERTSERASLGWEGGFEDDQRWFKKVQVVFKGG